MALDTEQMESECIEAIEANKLTFINEIFAFVPFCSSTFYDKGLEKSESIKRLLDKHRISTKIKLKKRWEDSENATLQIGLYKLIGTTDEVHRLSGTRQEIDTNQKISFNIDSDDIDL